MKTKRLLSLVGLTLALASLQFDRARLTAQTDRNVVVDPKTYQDLRWRSVGPHRGGRVTAVAGVRTQPGTFYMGATGGGVWKTVNYGILWTPVTDGQISTGSIGAIDVSDSNPDIIYVGTGSSAIRSNIIIGKGVYKSTDAGKTWTFVGLREVGQIGSLHVHPTNPDIAYVAALGNPFGFGPDRGVYRTKDGGKSWQKVLFINDETGVVSLTLNWRNPDELYAGAWRAARRPWTIISGGPASTGGVYKTSDGGDRWTRVSNGLPKDLIGKVWVDLAQSNARIVYAMVEAPTVEGGLYRSDDAGQSWRLVNNEQRLRARPFYFNYVHVNPKSENEVWVNELRLHKSVDGGKTWAQVGTPHGDNHGMWFNPDNPNIIIQSNDGGANVTQDGGQSWSSILNQPTGEFYHVDTDEQFPYRIYGPQQDNSTVVLASLPPHAWRINDATQSWSEASGCETGQIRPIPSGKIVYGDCKGEFGRYDTTTGQEQHYWIYPQQRYGLNPRDQKYRFVRQAPIEIDPRDPNVVYHGSQFVHRTTDGGVRWQTISPDLTANEADKQVASGEPITRDVTGEEVYSALYSIRASRLEPGVIWTGSNDGPVWVTRDNGKTWKNVTPPGLPPGGRVHMIEDSPHRRGSAYVAVYRLYLNDFQPHLFMTNDYGERWTRLTDGRNGIPADHPMHVVREDPRKEGLLYAGTWFGAFVSFDQGQHWQSLQQNLPATPVTDIKVHRDDLVISTMGRSFWIMDDVAPLRQTVPTLTSTPTFLFQPSDAYRMRYTAIVGRVDQPTYPASGARIDYYLGTAPSGEIALEILDAGGRVIRSYSSESRPGGRGGGGAAGALSKKAGMNRFVWDLRYVGSPAESGDPDGGGGRGGGPLVAPETYTVRLTAQGAPLTRPVTVRIDPRVAQAGVTQPDLVEQAQFALRVRDTIFDVNQLAARIRQALQQKTGNQARLQALYDRLVNKPGPYPENQLIAQFQNVASEIGQADQKIGASAFERFSDLLQTLSDIRAQTETELPKGR